MGVQRVTFRFDVDRNVNLILIASHDLTCCTRARISMQTLSKEIFAEVVFVPCRIKQTVGIACMDLPLGSMGKELSPCYETF